MLEQRLTTIWSLHRRAPVLLRVWVRHENPRLLRIERILELGL